MELPRGSIGGSTVLDDVYAKLGVRRVLNATCHWTRFGGTIMPPPVLDAMRAAADAYVDLHELQDAASRVIAEHTHAQAGYVVSGCAAALMLGAAAVMTGDDPVAMARLPDTAGLKNEWIARPFPRRRSKSGQEYVHYGYAHAVRGAGGVFVERLDGFGDRTAGVYWVPTDEPGVPSPEEAIALAHDHGVPILIDASNTLPPPEHLHRFLDAGADLVGFSGGKGLRGPQGSGILAGRADLIRAARMQGAPTQGIGRVCKVSKEEVVGLITALELYVRRDHRAERRAAEKRTLWLADQLGGLVNAEAEYVAKDHIGRPYPTVHLRLDPAEGLTAADLLDKLLAGSPPVAAMGGPDEWTIRLDVRELDDRDVQRVADAVLAVLMPGSAGR
ncbi:MAG TPA: aminotransferase class V-fold PLP-dependent enzyme [Chloroflexota bacterium]|nr:aminotransferase class V-fold PLP-dependent enzyme [Chloroflexota bacterium]